LKSKSLNNDEATGLLKVVTDYAYALDILDKYDHQALTIEGTTVEELFIIDYTEAKRAIYDLKENSMAVCYSVMRRINLLKALLLLFINLFDSCDLYPSVEEKAANLLYFVVKNHSLSDGNKRIAAYLFVWSMEKNGILYRQMVPNESQIMH
jgi:prophage maintenance system killer protein